MAKLKNPVGVCNAGSLNNIHPSYLVYPVGTSTNKTYRDQIMEKFQEEVGSANLYEVESAPSSYFGAIWAKTVGDSNA